MKTASALGRLLAGALLLSLAAPALPAQADLAAAKQETRELPDLKDLVDDTVRWLRAQQDPEGSYGGSIATTAWVLRAFAKCPRHYQRHDGPFVSRALDYLKARQREDGSIVEEGDSDNNAQTNAVYCSLALSEFSDEQSRAMLEKLDAHYTNLQLAKPAPLTPEEARKQAFQFLDRRLPNGRWEGPMGEILETATAALELSESYVALKSAGSSTPTEALPKFTPADRKAALTAIGRGADFLVADAENGRFGAAGRPDAGLTAMAIGGLQAVPEPRPDAVQKVIDQGLAWLASLQKESGAIHDGKLANYTTSAAVLALARSGKDEYRETVLRARKFLVSLQSDESEGYSEGDLYYGGIGYGDDERPDLSNLQFALEALYAAGLEPGDAAYKRAVKFLQRVQNRSESNDIAVADGDSTIVSGDDGGAAYYPGGSQAGFVELADGRKVPRSYGSMTYALLKSYILAGVSKDDPRVQAAWKWIREHYTLDVNPGFDELADPHAAYQGLFYYFVAMARALDAMDKDVIDTPDGAHHPWRQELCGRLVAMQSRENGSWVNRNSPRWWEGNPVLATAYALLALDAATPKAD